LKLVSIVNPLNHGLQSDSVDSTGLYKEDYSEERLWWS